MQNDFSIIVDVRFRLRNAMLAHSGPLRLETRINIAFSYDMSCVLQAQVQENCI